MLMRRTVILLTFWLFCGGAASAAHDQIHLKEKGAINGKILAEKKDQIVIDVGYTVLVVPRDQISKILRATGVMAKSKGAEKSETDKPLETHLEFYRKGESVAPRSTVKELVNQLGEAVAQVRTPGGLGSGFIINEEGYLITNFHVIEGETQISIEVYQEQKGQLERKSYKDVRIIAIDRFADLALLKIDDEDAPRFNYVPVGSTDPLGVGEEVFAIGSPLGLERTVTEGIVSTKTRQMQGRLYLQTSTQINPGNSGGPLFNLSGEVVGVTNMKMTFSEGLAFAIPSEQVKYFLDHRDAYAYDNDNPSNAYRYLPPPSRRSTNTKAKD
jgi:serine protease Do